MGWRQHHIPFPLWPTICLHDFATLRFINFSEPPPVHPDRLRTLVVVALLTAAATSLRLASAEIYASDDSPAARREEPRLVLRSSSPQNAPVLGVDVLASSLPPSLRFGRGRGRASRRPPSPPPRGVSRGRGHGFVRVTSPERVCAHCSGAVEGPNAYAENSVFPPGWSGFRDPAFFTVGGGIPLLHLPLRRAGLVPEWPAAIRAQVFGYGPRWIYVDRHAGVSVIGPKAVPKPRKFHEGQLSGWEPCPWKGEQRGFTYNKSVTVPLVLDRGHLRFDVWCAYVEALGPTVVLGRDFCLLHAVWAEFDASNRPVLLHVDGRPIPCEPVERAYAPRRPDPRGRS